jgi:hypothetical protein
MFIYLTHILVYIYRYTTVLYKQTDITEINFKSHFKSLIYYMFTDKILKVKMVNRYMYIARVTVIYHVYVVTVS